MVRANDAPPRVGWLARLVGGRRPAGPTKVPHPADSAPKEAVGGAKPAPVLLRREQATVAVVLLVCLAISGGIWWSRGGSTQQPFERRPNMQQVYRIDLNRCGWVELAQVTGIGETLARRIVELRDERGGFRSAHELLDVKGIGPKKFAELKPYLLPLESGSTSSDTPQPAE